MKQEEQIKRIIEDKLHVKIRHNGETLFDMGADSLDVIELINEFEDTFDIHLLDTDIVSDMTVRDVISLVKEARKHETKS